MNPTRLEKQLDREFPFPLLLPLVNDNENRNEETAGLTSCREN
jgi:hypothetical protein